LYGYTTIVCTATPTGQTGLAVITKSGGVDGTSYLYVNGHNHFQIQPISGSAGTVWHSGIDGAGSGLDADTVDGFHSYQFPHSTDNSGYGWGSSMNVSNMNAVLGTTSTTQRCGFSTYNNPTNSPNGDWVHWISHFGSQWVDVDKYGFQIAHGFWNNNMWVRRVNDDTWGSWVKMWNADNDGSGSGLDADLLDGIDSTGFIKGTTNTWITDAGSVQRFYFQASSTTYVKGHGSTPIEFRNGSDANITNIDSSGNLTAVANVTAYSDIRLKEDLLVINSALDKVMTLTGYTFTRKDSKQRQTGLIAQDVEKILAEAVMTDEKTGIKSLAYGNLMGLMVEAIKELKREIEELKR
jgi:hypothetical protein